MKKSNKSKNKDNINVIEQNNIDNKDIKVEKSKNNQKQNKEETSLIVVNENKKRKKKKKTKRHLFLKFILIMIILLMLLAISGMWLFAGLLLGWFGNNIDISKEDLSIKVSNSVVVDKDGNILADLSGDEKRKIISLDEMADYLPKAYIAIEDERFYEHSGVDFKRTAGAIMNTLLNGTSDYGGSTITQQLVKNITNDNESTGIEGIKRKIREWQRAYQVERMISKQEILELYLNILFVGGNNLHGVELGAEYYFNKSAKDLSLAECAFMAGINHSPNSYNPYNGEDNAEAIKNRTITVLNKMKELGYIVNEDEYNQAIEQVNAGLTFTNGSNNNVSIFSYHTDAVISQVVEQVMEERQMTEQMARNYVYSSGLTIHSTVDTNIQNRLEEEYKNSRYIRSGRVRNSDGTLLNEHTQSGMAIIDYKTGNVVAVTGTTDNVYDRWLCGFTQYYSAATWYGYDNSEPVVYSGNPAGQIWDAVMTDIHEGLPDATFERPEGIVERKVCSRTGGLATSRCRNTYTEIFTEDNLPETCKGENIIPKENLKLWTTLTRSRNNRKT